MTTSWPKILPPDATRRRGSSDFPPLAKSSEMEDVRLEFE